MKLPADILGLLAERNITIGLAYDLDMRGRVTDEMMQYAVYSGNADLYAYLVKNAFDFFAASDETIKAVFESGATAYAHPFCAGLAARVATTPDRNELARLAVLADAGLAVVEDLVVSAFYTQNDARLVRAAFDRSEPVAMFLVASWRRDGPVPVWRYQAIKFGRKAVFLYLLDIEGGCLRDLVTFQRWGWIHDYLDRVAPSVEEQSEALMVCIREGGPYLGFAMARGITPFNSKHIAQLLMKDAFVMAWDIIECSHPNCRTLDWHYIMYESYNRNYDYTKILDWAEAHGLKINESVIRKYQ